jgi:hypothetical protein
VLHGAPPGLELNGGLPRPTCGSIGSQVGDGRETAGDQKNGRSDQKRGHPTTVVGGEVFYLVAVEGTSGVSLEATREARLCYGFTIGFVQVYV